MKEYIIISLKHGIEDRPMFWRANDAGYTNSPFAAGKYSEEQVKSNESYYNNGITTVAVALTDEAMRTIGFHCCYSGDGLVKYYSRSEL